MAKRGTGLLWRLIDSTSRYRVEFLDKKSLLVVDTKREKNAWPSKRAQLSSLLEHLGIDLVIDVGANTGQFAQEIRAFYPGELISFEPVPAVFEKLKQRADGDKHWHAYSCALGSEDGEKEIHVSRDTVFSSFLKPSQYALNRFRDRVDADDKENVQVSRLDSFLERERFSPNERKICLKLDTQGYDLHVVRGSERILHNVKILLAEVSVKAVYEELPHWTESLKFFESLGFSVAGMFPVSRDGWEVIEYDCLLIRP
jgi:FkbM family methyltransferase